MSAPSVILSAAAESQATTLSVSGLRSLLRAFERASAQKPLAPDQLVQHKVLLEQFERIHRSWEKRQLYFAENFNMLRTMRLTTKELCHSDILAWLLDHRLDGFGTHAQRKQGFRLFLKAVDLPLEFANAGYRVAREVPGKESRLDLLIEAERKFIIGIENKIASHEILGFGDEKDQTEREWDDLQSRGKKLDVPPDGIKAFFLTPDSERPKSRNFTSISWHQMAAVFEAFAAEARPPMVRLFAQHYAEALRQDVTAEAQTLEEDNE